MAGMLACLRYQRIPNKMKTKKKQGSLIRKRWRWLRLRLRLRGKRLRKSLILKNKRRL
jgi:hypothetical protein